MCQRLSETRSDPSVFTPGQQILAFVQQTLRSSKYTGVLRDLTGDPHARVVDVIGAGSMFRGTAVANHSDVDCRVHFHLSQPPGTGFVDTVLYPLGRYLFWDLYFEYSAAVLPVDKVNALLGDDESLLDYITIAAVFLELAVQPRSCSVGIRALEAFLEPWGNFVNVDVTGELDDHPHCRIDIDLVPFVSTDADASPRLVSREGLADVALKGTTPLDLETEYGLSQPESEALTDVMLLIKHWLRSVRYRTSLNRPQQEVDIDMSTVNVGWPDSVNFIAIGQSVGMTAQPGMVNTGHKVVPSFLVEELVTTLGVAAVKEHTAAADGGPLDLQALAVSILHRLHTTAAGQRLKNQMGEVLAKKMASARDGFDEPVPIKARAALATELIDLLDAANLRAFLLYLYGQDDCQPVADTLTEQLCTVARGRHAHHVGAVDRALADTPWDLRVEVMLWKPKGFEDPIRLHATFFTADLWSCDGRVHKRVLTCEMQDALQRVDDAIKRGGATAEHRADLHSAIFDPAWTPSEVPR